MLFEETLSEISANRLNLTQALLCFVETDTLLFLPEDKVVEEALNCSNQVLHTSFELAFGLDVPTVNLAQRQSVLSYLDMLPIKKFMSVYLLATELRSVLLAVLYVEKKLSVDEIFRLAFYEELLQQKQWGCLEENISFHNKVKQKLEEIENYLDHEDLSTN